MSKTGYIERVNGFIVPYLAKNGYELIKTEFINEDNNYYLRLYIDLTADELAQRKAKLETEEMSEDKAAAEENAETAGETLNAAADAQETADAAEELTPGVSINDCVKVSRYLSKWLDKEDFINEMYTMEVCSRGFLDAAASKDE